VRQRIAAMPPSHDPSTDFADERRFLSVPIGVICGCCFMTTTAQRRAFLHHEEHEGGCVKWENGGRGEREKESMRAWERGSMGGRGTGVLPVGFTVTRASCPRLKIVDADGRR
jgi:hypothetical protein